MVLISGININYPNNMKTSAISASLIILAQMWTYGQEISDGNVFPEYNPTPQTFSMISRGDIDFNLNTGTYSISIPIYTYEDPDFSFPIVLRYDSDGFRPGTQTGIVGLNWTLATGGTISREIRGFDDLKSLGYAHKTIRKTPDETYRLQYSVSHHNDRTDVIIDQTGHETSPDLFHFNFMGHSGSFTYDENNRIKVFGTTGASGLYSIEYDSLTDCFHISTGDGYEYWFGEWASNNEKSLDHNSVPDIYSMRIQETSTVSWLLSRVKAPNGRQVVIDYISGRSNMSIPVNGDHVFTSFTSRYYITSIEPLKKEYYKSASMVYTSLMTGISVKETDGRMFKVAEFDYSQREYSEAEDGEKFEYRRLAVALDKLDRIRIYSRDGILKEASLSYEYLCNSRLALKEIRISDSGSYIMRYNSTDKMPGISSNSIDFWGYYNGKDNFEYQLWPTTVTLPYYDEKVNSVFRNPDWHFSIAGTLRRITYPTGGYTDFEYEPHMAYKIIQRVHDATLVYDDDPPFELGQKLDPFIPAPYICKVVLGSEECGGVRIKRITHHDNTGNSFWREYEYKIPGKDRSSGMIMKFNRFFTKMLGDKPVYNQYINFPGNGFDKYHILYSAVTERFPDGSSKTYRYSNYLDYPDEFSVHRKSHTPDYTDDRNYMTFLDNILREPDSRHYRRGELISEETVDRQGRALSRAEYTYGDSDSSYVAFIVGSGQYWWSARRFTCDRKMTGLKRTEFIYNLDSTDCRQITTVSEIKYNKKGQVTLRKTTDSTGTEGNAVYTLYCRDSGQYIDDSRFPSNIYTEIKTRIHNGNEYITGRKDYRYTGSSISQPENPAPKEMISWSVVPQKYEGSESKIFNAFLEGHRDTLKIEYGNLFRPVMATTIPGGSYVKYIWDNDMTHIVSKEQDDPDNTFRFAWKDMVGLTGITYPSGQSAGYIYDNRNRISYETDSDSEPIIKYEYHLVNE